jgi:phage gp36-like protein
MPYATESDLVAAAGDLDRLNQLVENRAAPTSEPDPRAYWIRQALDAGDALVDSHLAPTFRTPLTSPSKTIIMLAASEGIYYLVRTRGLATEAELQAHTERVETLERMRESKQWPGDPLPATTRNPRGKRLDNATAVSRKRMEGFI